MEEKRISLKSSVTGDSKEPTCGKNKREDAGLPNVRLRDMA